MVDLYIAPVTKGELDKLFPWERQKQLEGTVNENHRRQRYTVWKLLEYGLFHSLGLSMEQVEFTLDSRGRWFCPQCFFSLSHSANAVAVAISDAPVGVDIESLQRTVHPALERKILTEEEQAEYAALEESRQKQYLLEKWCCKESLFKWKETKREPPAKKPCTGTVTVATENYCYAVATEEKAPLRIMILEETGWN